MSRLVASSMVLFAVCTSAAGAMEVRDLRFGIGLGPTPDDHSGTFTPDDGSAPFPVKFGFGAGDAVTGVISATYGSLDPIGFIGGLDLRYSNGHSTMDLLNGSSLAGRGAPDSSYVESAAALHAGLGWALGESDHLELVGLLGIAWVELESPANISTNLAAQRGQGSGVVSGARIGWHHTWVSNWQIGLEAEWTTTDADLTTNYKDGTLESTMVNSGYGARVVLGYRH